MIDLKAIYLTTLERCAPNVLVQRVVRDDMPRNVVAIGKCAGALLDGVARVLSIENAFVAIPETYPLPHTRADIAIGGHPQMTHASFEAGARLLEFVDAHRDILFLISGGGSACVEVARSPHTEEELIATNAKLIASGKPIGEINATRKELSAIKGGRLAERVRGRNVTLVYSDVATGRLDDVASGPGRDPILIADNHTLTDTAAKLCNAIRWPGQLEADVETAARELAERALQLNGDEVLVAGGEPTVVVRGEGRGGRCSELAVRFARKTTGIQALFASSDGVDGNSGCAGIFLPAQRSPIDDAEVNKALAESDSFRIAAQLGEPIMIRPTANNLRDLFLLARG
ncbi:MAG TPA: DUF4147 domain-containing protein [Thermoanaerobaculia bacterium]|nr:DUF4147 domain-containing protein [Thermoanaerobaculia bacterium]